MSESKPYRYAVVRVVPRVDRDEFLNAGVIVFAPGKRYLGASIRLREDRLRALWPSANVEDVRRHLHSIDRVCEGDGEAGAIAQLSKSERFHWLTAPRSAMIQTSPVRVGLSDHPEALLDELTAKLVA